MACGVKKFPSPSLRLLPAVAVLGVALLAGCSPKPQAVQDADAYMRAQGYARAPQILGITGSGDTVTVSGEAAPEGRVRFQYGGQHSIGITADSRGRFKAELPLTAQGGLFDISMEDTGRLVQAEGRLFIPPGAPQKAVLMRAGSPSLPLAPGGAGIAVVDYDAAGAMMITGIAAPHVAIAATIDGESWPKQPAGGDKGAFTAICQIPPPQDAATPVNVVIQAGGATFTRSVPVSKAPQGDRITAIDGGGWRVDWIVPGGGMQTTVVF